MAVLLPVALALALALALVPALLLFPTARAYKTYGLSTGKNFVLEDLTRIEGALVIRDEEEEEVSVLSAVS